MSWVLTAYKVTVNALDKNNFFTNHELLVTAYTPFQAERIAFAFFGRDRKPNMINTHPIAAIEPPATSAEEDTGG